MYVKLLDSFGTIMAEGELTVHDSPGGALVQDHSGTTKLVATTAAPSVSDLLRTNLYGRTTLNCQHIPPALAWSIQVSDV